MVVYVKMEEPDIFLVTDIGNYDSDALMLNTEVQFKYWSQQKSQAIMATLCNIRCYTCQFNPHNRDRTMAGILAPCTISLSYSQNEDHGLKVQCNVTDLCLNVAIRSIQIIQESVDEFMKSMDSMAEKDLTESSITENEKDFTALWEPE